MQEHEQMESFIVGLSKQMMNEALVLFENSQGFQMPYHATDHARHPCNCL